MLWVHGNWSVDPCAGYLKKIFVKALVGNETLLALSFDKFVTVEPLF